jgi:hypothetical protein
MFVHTGSSGEWLPHGPWLGLFRPPAPLKSMAKSPLQAKCARHSLFQDCVGRLGPPAVPAMLVPKISRYYICYIAMHILVSTFDPRSWHGKCGTSKMTMAVSLASQSAIAPLMWHHSWLTNPHLFRTRLLDSATTDLGGIEKLASNVLSGCQQPFYVFHKRNGRSLHGRHSRRGAEDLYPRKTGSQKNCALACNNARITDLSMCTGREDPA